MVRAERPAMENGNTNRVREAITARLWDCLPKLLNGLPAGPAARGGVTEQLVQELAGRLCDAVTKSVGAGSPEEEVERLASRAFDAERSLRDAQRWVGDLDEEVEAIRRR